MYFGVLSIFFIWLVHFIAGFFFAKLETVWIAPAGSDRHWPAVMSSVLLLATLVPTLSKWKRLHSEIYSGL